MLKSSYYNCDSLSFLCCVPYTCTIWWEGTKTTQISSRGPKGVEEENELICHQYIYYDGPNHLIFFVKSQQSFFKCCDLEKKVEIFFRWSKQLDQEFRCRNQDLDIKQNHMSWPNIIVIHTYDIYFYSSYSSIDVALIFPRAFFWYFTDENA